MLRDAGRWCGRMLAIVILVAAGAGGAGAQGGLVDLSKVYLVAQDHINAVALDFPAEFAGATVKREPQPCFDLNGEVSALILDVVRNGTPVGYVTVGASETGPVIMESSPGLSPFETVATLYQAAGQTKAELKNDLRQAKTVVYYLGGIEYYARSSSGKIASGSILRLADLATIPESVLIDKQTRRSAFLKDAQRQKGFAAQWSKVGAAAPAAAAAAPQAATTPYIRVNWPNAANSVMNRGTSYQISYTVTSVSYVKIELYKAGTFKQTIASSVAANAGGTQSTLYYSWTPATSTIPGSDYKIKVTSTANSGLYDTSDNNFYITGRKVASGCDDPSTIYRYNWYRGCSVSADTMILSYIGDHGFPELSRSRFPVTTFDWIGPSQNPRIIARGLADLLANDRGFPQSGGTGSNYGASLSAQVTSVKRVVQGRGYGSWSIQSQDWPNPNADTYRAIIDKNRPGQMGFYDHPTYGDHSTTFVGYSFHTVSSDRASRIIYIFDTWDQGLHAITFESLNDIDYYDANPPAMVVAYPSASGLTLRQGQAVGIKWGGWASQTGSSSVKVELYKGSALNRTIWSTTTNDGAENWTVPSTQTTGSDFKIKITSTNDTAANDNSDYYFTIAAAAPTVSSFLINNNVASTAVRVVTLNNSCTGSPTYYMASESSSFSGIGWKTYSTAPSFTLSAGNGTKTVYFKVKNSSNVESTVKSDTITLNEPTPIVNLTVNASPVSGNISSGTDVDWFKFTVPSSGSYTIETWAGTLTDSYMYLYGPNSQTALIEADDDDGTGYMSWIGLLVLSPGTYYVKMKGYSSGYTGSYTIQVRLNTTVALTANAAAVSGNISLAGEADWYKFTVSTMGAYTIETWAGSLTDGYISLYGPDTQRTLIEADDDDGTGYMSWIGPRVLSPGTYYIKAVAYYGSDTGSYTIQVRSSSLATLTVNGSRVSGNISSGNDSDWFKFTVPSAGSYTIETWAGTLSDNYMHLYGPNNQNTLITGDDDSGTGYMSLIGPWTLAAGTYYVQVHGYDSADIGSYSIQVRH